MKTAGSTATMETTKTTPFSPNGHRMEQILIWTRVFDVDGHYLDLHIEHTTRGIVLSLADPRGRVYATYRAPDGATNGS